MDGMVHWYSRQALSSSSSSSCPAPCAHIRSPILHLGLHHSHINHPAPSRAYWPQPTRPLWGCLWLSAYCVSVSRHAAVAAITCDTKVMPSVHAGEYKHCAKGPLGPTTRQRWVRPRLHGTARGPQSAAHLVVRKRLARSHSHRLLPPAAAAAASGSAGKGVCKPVTTSYSEC
jgi:hypothetical protein